MRFFSIFLISVISVSAVSCSSFIIDSDYASLRELEAYTYVLQKDVLNNREVVMKKGSVVKVVLKSDSTWVKVYAYPAEEDTLVSTRSLILFIFDDEFPDKLFKREFFDQKFAEYFVRGAAVESKKGKTPVKTRK
jgi:type II secretion system-associated lipoprotein